MNSKSMYKDIVKNVSNREPQENPFKPQSELPEDPRNPFLHPNLCKMFDEHNPKFGLQTICFLVQRGQGKVGQFLYQLKQLIEHHLKDGIWRKEPPQKGIVLRSSGTLTQKITSVDPYILSFHGQTQHRTNFLLYCRMLFPSGILSNSHLKNYPGAPSHFTNAATNSLTVAEVTPTDDIGMSPILL